MRTVIGKWGLTGLVLILLTASNVAASGTTALLVDGIRQYREGSYAAAAESFVKVTEAGISNGKLYYNLGNAYLKQGDVGRAVLWYKRAVKMVPGDPDLKFNLTYALSLVKDKVEEDGPSVSRVLMFWRQYLSRIAVQWAAISFSGLLWSMLLIHLILGRKVLNTWNFAVLGLTVALVLTALMNYYDDHYVKKAVVLPERVSIRSGLSDKATELFVLHAGSEVRVEKENNGFARIYYSNGKIGWLPIKDVGII